ncbi:MAG: hypothetical protein A2Y73_08260 [Chloroflexi bacterium RBG_13_56_8]|nr:MAG: hypothetical protein A2Y73_08260 [Chloroflexi bacterium RBG_13_56_8]
MDRWEHSITVHTVGELLSKVSPVEEERVIYCDASAGSCFFDEAPNPYLEAMVGTLDELGQEGWELVQGVLREEEMICFWRRMREADIVR